MHYINFLIQLTEKDKRIIIALLIIFIIVFVLIAYIGNGIKALMRRYGKGIDGYMYKLCDAGLVTNPKQFYAQVYNKETRKLYFSTKWLFRIFFIALGLFLIYGFWIKPPVEGEATFAFVAENLKKLKIVFETPTGKFFFFENFPIDFPRIVSWPTPEWNLPSITTYIMLIITIVTFIGVSNATLKFMARLSRARTKGKEAFTQSLDNANFAK